MMFEKILTPYLFINRLVVMSKGKRVYDEEFHTGLNIIRGDNGKGKTTIADFIFFGLGGKNVHWKQEALQCDYVYCEICVSGQLWTTRREIRPEGRSGTDIFEGNFDIASTTSDGWRHYAAARTAGGRESYSQLLFSQLGIPEVTEEKENLTIHKLLRALYVDQISPMNSLLYTDTWDTALIREMIGDVLFGIYSPELFNVLVNIRKLEDALDLKKREHKNLKNLLSEAGFLLEPIEIQARLNEIDKQYEEIPLEKSEGKQEFTLEQSIADMNHELSRVLDEINVLTFEIQDSNFFISALNNKLKHLEQSIATRNYFGEFRIDTCLICLSKIDIENVDDSICHLCHSEVSKISVHSSLIRFREEIKFQIQESEKLQNKRKNHIEEKRTKANQIKSNISSVTKIIKDKVAIRDSIESNYDLSFIIKKAELIAEKKELEKNIFLINKLAGLASDIRHTSESLEEARENKVRIENTQKDRKSQVLREIDIFTRDFLSADSRYEHELANFDKVEIDFSRNTFALDGKNNFSASSVVYLKNSICFSIFFASLKKEFMCYPRFILCDNTEDKGMQPERSQAFQRKVAELSNSFLHIPHQIILTTSMIANDLNTPQYCVGHFFTDENRALQLSGTDIGERDEVHVLKPSTEIMSDQDHETDNAGDYNSDDSIH